jgi:hypothetical protein
VLIVDPFVRPLRRPRVEVERLFVAPSKRSVR